MNERDLGTEFLKLFRTLEEELVTMSKLNDEYVSFSRALNKIYYDHLNPVISDPDVFEFLKSASDLRNILSHRNDVCLPTIQFFNRFKALVKEIENPVKCKDICTKGNSLIICHSGNLVREVVSEMVKTGLSHIPVISAGKVIGVFSRTSLFEKYSNDKAISLNGDSKVIDFEEEIKLDRHSNETYLFVSPNTPVKELYKVMYKKKAKDRRLSCVFVTDNGQEDGRLIGIITETDLVTLPFDRIDL